MEMRKRERDDVLFKNKRTKRRLKVVVGVFEYCFGLLLKLDEK